MEREPKNKEISYRRMVSNIFRQLSAEDVQQIAYVRLEGKEDTTKYSAAKQTSKALDLMQTLQRYDFFSQDDLDGLKDVLKDANRSDLVKQVETDMRKLKLSPCHVKNKRCRYYNWRQKSAEVLPAPTEELEDRLRNNIIKEQDEGWTKKAQPANEKEPIAQCTPKGKKLLTAREPPKKIPLLPPDKIQETNNAAKTYQQQQPLLPFKAPETSPNTSKPCPPKPPPKIVSRSHSEDKDDTDRDSGLWTGSATESVTEWTQHHKKAPSDNVSEYQSLLSVPADNKHEDHQYATPIVN